MIKNLDQIVANARSYLNKGWTYKLGGDSDTKKQIDCSAFIWRVLGEKKYSPELKKWRNTNWLVSDEAQQYFQRIPNPIPGSIAVYGWTTRSDGSKKVGHVAVVVDPSTRTIIDAASSTNGITERNGSFFWNKPNTVWLIPRGASTEASDSTPLLLLVLLIGSLVYINQGKKR